MKEYEDPDYLYDQKTLNRRSVRFVTHFRYSFEILGRAVQKKRNDLSLRWYAINDRNEWHKSWGRQGQWISLFEVREGVILNGFVKKRERDWNGSIVECDTPVLDEYSLYSLHWINIPDCTSFSSCCPSNGPQGHTSTYSSGHTSTCEYPLPSHLPSSSLFTSLYPCPCLPYLEKDQSWKDERENEIRGVSHHKL